MPRSATVPAGLTRCSARNPRTLNSLRSFLRTHGDDLPEKAIRKATAPDTHKRWLTLCDRSGAVKAAIRYEPNDWYLCTMKNAAVAPELRGRGIGKYIYRQTAEAALAARGDGGYPLCHVLAGDVTFDNVASRKAAEGAGLHAVNKFCWGKGQKPAEILHYVRVRPQGNRCK